jgi:alpha-tubulin suppressor-like RCC1 family protein
MKKLHYLFLVFLNVIVLQAQHVPTIVGGKGVSATLTAEGNVLAWGLNAVGPTGAVVKGVLGVGSTSQNVPVPTKVIFPAGVSIKQLGEASGFYFLAVSCEGNVYAWGDNSAGQLGNGSTVTQTAPVAVKVQANSPVDLAGFRDPVTGNLRRISKVCAGGNTSFAITDDGRLLSWGCNSSGCNPIGTGLLGNNLTQNSLFPTFVINGLINKPLENVIQVSAGDYLALALVDDDQEGLGIGTVYSWGPGTNSTLGRNAAGTGNNRSEISSSNVARPVRFVNDTEGYNGDGILSNIKSIATADVAGFALDDDGYVWAWGTGGWGGVTGQGVTINHSDPRRVLKGTVYDGEGTDGKYLLARSISGGLGFAAAVTLDGKTVAWGNNACSGNAVGPASTPNFSCGGNLGNNGSDSYQASPVYVQFGTGNIHNDIIYVSCTGFGGYYIRSDNSIWAWGDNSVGQLGDGSYVTKNRAVQLSLPAGNTSLHPSPFFKIRQKDTQVCASKLLSNPIILESDLVLNTTLMANYKFTWYRVANPSSPVYSTDTSNFNIVKTGIGVASSTFSANRSGRYWLKVEYVGTVKPCGGYAPAYDYMTLNTYQPSFTAKSNLTYCGDSAKVSVSQSPSGRTTAIYDWFPTSTSTISLGRTIGNSETIINHSAVIANSGNKIVFVEEKYSATGAAVATEPSATFNDVSGSQVAGQIGNSSSGNDMYFKISEDIKLDTVSIYAKTYTSQPTSYTFQFRVYGVNSSGCGSNFEKADRFNSLASGMPINAIVNPTYTLIKIPVNISLKGNVPYFLGLTTNLQGSIKEYTSVSGMTNSNSYSLENNTPKTDNLGGYTLKIYGTDNGRCPAMAGVFGSFINWQFSVAQKYCDRLPVTLKQNCNCAAPAIVTAQSAPTATGTPKAVTASIGSSINLSGFATLNPTPATNGISYVWYKKGTAIGAYSALPIANKILNSVSDNGTWVLRVEDGTKGNAVCYKEDSIQVTFSVATALNSDLALEGTSIYPNPFKDDFTIHSTQNLAGAKLKLMDAQGKVVLEQELSNNSETINTSSFSQGFYIVHITKDGHVIKYNLAKLQ